MMKRLTTLLCTLFISAFAYAQDCNITNLTATANDCVEQNFSVSINFQIADNTSSNFTVLGNGQNYGSFSFSDLPITIGPLSGDGETDYEFIVFDNDDLDCQASVELGTITCGPFCSFDNAVMEFFACQTNILALVELDFDYENVEGNAFDLFYPNGNPAGSFLYSSLPVSITNLVTNGNEAIQLLICDDNSDCCELFTFPAIDCNPNNCEIYNLVAEPFCDGNALFFDIDFGFENTPGSVFNIKGNGINHGDFNYSELPITLGPFNGASTIPWEFVVADTTNQNCDNAIDVGITNCPMDCKVNALEIETIECTSNNTYTISVNADVLEPGDNGFTLFTGNMVLGTYNYADLPVTITDYPASGNFIDKISFCDNENIACCFTTEFNALLCAGCVIYNVTATPQPCDGDGNFEVIIDFNFQNEGTLGFQIGGNGNDYGTFQFEDLPITLGPFDADGNTFYEFLILDQENIGCIAAAELGEITCDQICNISDVAVTDLACNGADTYSFNLNFNFTGEEIIGFDIYANNVLIGFYGADNLPFNIQNFPASGNDMETLTIRNHDDFECFEEFTFESIDCELPCTVEGLEIDTVTCENDTNYRVVFNFEYANTNGNTFNVFGNGVFLGNFEKGDGNLVVENFPITLIEQQELRVCANDDSTCCQTIVFMGPNCLPDPCDIRDIELISTSCDSDTTFQANINFISENTNGNLYDIYCDDELIATLEKNGDNPIEIEGILLNDTQEKTIRICANDLPDCCDQITIITPDCGIDSCEINIVSLFSIECISDTTFRLNVTMNNSNVGTNLYDVYNFGNFVGLFEVNENSFSIPAFPTSEGEFNEIIICRSGDVICCDTVEFEGLICDPEQCLISDVFVETSDCTSDSTFTAILDFNYQNTGSDTFDIFGVSGYITTIVKGEMPDTLENFEANSLGEYVITICATDVNDCCANRFFDGPVCTSECTIYDLDVNVIECTSPEEYSAIVDFEAVNLSGQAVNIFLDGDFVGLFEYDTLPITISEIPFDGEDQVTLMVCDTAIDGCCMSIEYEPFDCGDLFCSINNLEYEVTDCDTAGNFFINLSFNFSGEGELGYSVRGNGTTYGTFPYSVNPVMIGPLVADTLIEYEFLVADVDNPACFDFVGVGIVECETVGIGRLNKISKARIYYQNEIAFFETIEDNSTIEIYSYDGRLIHRTAKLQLNEIIELTKLVSVPGIFILKVRTEENVSVGKFLR